MGPGLVVLLLLLAAAREVKPSMPGGLRPVPADDPGVASATRVAEEFFNRGSNDMFYSAVSNVTSAQVQVVAGLMYHLALEMRTTVCRKTEPDLRNCPFHQDPQHVKPMTCTFQIWYRPWIGPMEVSKSECSRALK